MDLFAFIGPPQLAALLVLVQRGGEELYSARNTLRLRVAGAREAGKEFYPVVAATHLAWIASIFFLIPADAPIVWPLIAYYLVLQVVRYWVIASLGGYWTHRILTLPGAPLAVRGPYRFISHPNYAVTIVETFVLPLAFGAISLAVIMTALWWTVLDTKMRIENEALAPRRKTRPQGVARRRAGGLETTMSIQ
jgi:methyltransferase